MYQRILAAVDGTYCSRLALDEALRIAAASDGTVIAVSVIEHGDRVKALNLGVVSDPESECALSGATKRVLEEAEERFKLHRVRGATRVVDVYGEAVAPVLNRVAAECGVDLIVVGTAGRHGMERLLLGSVAESLMRSASLPVLVVRDNGEGRP